MFVEEVRAPKGAPARHAHRLMKMTAGRVEQQYGDAPAQGATTHQPLIWARKRSQMQ
jgi:hypothetical protein